jgi:hypothetical protein
VIVGFGHRAGVGKDTCAQFLVERHGFRRVAFADPIRRLVYDSDPAARRRVDALGWEAAKRAHAHVRTQLELVGESGRRSLWPEVWIDALFRRIGDDAERTHIVVPDVRYENEARAILDAGGRVYRIDRPGHGPAHGMSERALLTWDGWSGVIVNDGTLDDLAARLDAVLATLIP